MIKNLIASLALTFVYAATCTASQPQYFSFNKVHLTEGDISIVASTEQNRSLLDTFVVQTSNGKIKLSADTINRITNPKLDTIQLALIPFDLDEGTRYFYQISMKFFGEEICSEETGSFKQSWAPQSEVFIVFWDNEYKVRFEEGSCTR